MDRFDGELNSVELLLPTQVASAPGGNFTNCRVSLALDVNPAGQVRLDNMGFH
ncbi:hypothetical protein [Sorangium cellulosum]|uniref:hypothetical protein n=1 Tax=Sorangium cellulosum TaxID=56 RepID=UPI003D9C02BE